MDRTEIKVGVAGAAVVGVAFGMARYAYGLTLPSLRDEFGLSELLLGMIASGTFAGYLVALLSVPWLSARRGPRAPTTVGGACGVVGCATVALAPSAEVLAFGAVLSGAAAGWVWAPYSDIVTAVAPRPDRPTLLAAITTGTSVGLAGLAALGVLGAFTSWRVTWAGISLAAAVAALTNVRTVPRVEGHTTERRSSQPSLWRRSLVAPLGYSVLFFAAITIYLTYASDAVRSGGLPAAAAPALFALVGAGGLVALLTGSLTRAVGAPVVGAASICGVAGALALLGFGQTSLTLVLASALVFGAGFMVGSSVLAVWTDQVVADRPGEGFSAALALGAVSSILTPVAMGALIPVAGLPTMLVTAAAISCVGAVVLPVVPRLLTSPGVRAGRT